jgi:hypothetical protein
MSGACRERARLAAALRARARLGVEALFLSGFSIALPRLLG